MFTGLIQGLGSITDITRDGRGARFRIECPSLSPQNWDVGASIAVAGCCLTALDIDSTGFSADLSAESLTKTTHGERVIGDQINLEHALRVGDALGGHYVTGHVDAIATVQAIEPLDAGNHRLEVLIPSGFEHYIAPKGSVTLDGVSLTVNEVYDHEDGSSSFWVNIIPHTWEVTTLGRVHVGSGLNFEVDVLARYLDRLDHRISQTNKVSTEQS